MDLGHYALLAELFDYPRRDFPERVERVREFIADRYPETREGLESFSRFLPRKDLDLMQELFTRTFDVQAVTTLDVGYLLFGDDYKRGELLANLSREHREAGTDCGGELGDHLPNLLRLLARLRDEELIRDMIDELIKPALAKMIAEFDPHQVARKNEIYRKHHKTVIEVPCEENLNYVRALGVLETVVKSDFPGEIRVTAPGRPSADFLRSIDNEIEVEEEVHA